ncbi:MAG: (2Fe-2S) ferredoxin domain-containing protein [Clostridiales bacterium]|nr:(2Fe-2S) ferredoxin domain-containing protein [Clostridiales bacterium]
MKKIKSFDELKKLRDQQSAKMTSPESDIRIIVGMATCGIAAGAGDVFDSIAGEIMKLGLDNVTVVRAGCMGACHSEPTVEIVIPGEKPVLYGNIDSSRAKVIVNSHIVRGDVVKDLVLEKNYDSIS